MLKYVNLKRLIVIPYENSSCVILKGKRGYWVWTPDMNCWPGTLDNCDSDDDLDDTEVVICGFRIDRKGSNESDAEYRGKAGFVEDNDPNSRIKSSVRPWPDYEEAVEKAEEWEKNDVQEEESLATRVSTVVQALVWSLLISLFAIIY